MDEFLQQFVLESRELVEQASADLLVLEKQPEDRPTLDSAFRAFHTLKGGAGIVDFVAMSDVLHAAEDALSGVRSGKREMTSRLVTECLAALDRVTGWLDEIESTGQLPTGAAPVPGGVGPTDVVSQGNASSEHASVESEAWVAALLARHPASRDHARCALVYTPARDCFFTQEDPLARVAGLPGLLAVELDPVVAWGACDEIEPFSCNLRISALVRGTVEEVEAAMQSVRGRCVIVSVDARASTAGSALPEPARELIEAQIGMLRETGEQGRMARIASAGRVVANVLRSVGRTADAVHVSNVVTSALEANDTHPLLRQLAVVLKSREGEVASPRPAAPPAPSRTVRVDAARVDKLVSLTGELIVVKNSLAHIASRAQAGDAGTAAAIRQTHAMLDSLLGQLRHAVLGMRVLPLAQVFDRFPRLVRELAAAAGKTMQLEIEGGETEADKVVVESLFEPLLHVVRNAVDHGVEHAELRRSRGKPALATLTLNAQRVGDRVVVEVADDGGGIDIDRVKSVALSRQLIDEATLQTISDERVVEMIFEPGFSTAQDVTSLSGRGVGMDAVRTAVGRVGGTVAIHSERGSGTTVRFELPFSVMLTSIMVVHSGGQAFGVPLDAVMETVRVDAGRIAPIGQARAMVLRGRTLPVLSLAQTLELVEPGAGTEGIVVVARGRAGYGGILVDAVGERTEIMLKPLEGLLVGMRGIAGSTLLGDGSVLLVLDLGELLA